MIAADPLRQARTRMYRLADAIIRRAHLQFGTISVNRFNGRVFFGLETQLNADSLLGHRVSADELGADKNAVRLAQELFTEWRIQNGVVMVTVHEGQCNKQRGRDSMPSNLRAELMAQYPEVFGDAL